MAAEAGGPSGVAGGGYQRRLLANPLISEIIDDAITAVTDEIAASIGDPANSFALRDGRYLGRTGDLDLWSFESDHEIPATPETPARLKVPGAEPLRCWVIASDDLDLIVGTNEAVTEEPTHARLSLEPVFILEKLRDRLGETEVEPESERLLETLMDLNDVADTPSSAVAVGEGLSGLSAEQRNVVARASRDGVQFVWGPPGTGKTGTLAAMVEHLVDGNERVLVLAHANAAVDVAMVRVAERMSSHHALLGGAVLRAGAPTTDEARTNEWINPDAILRRTVPALIEEHDRLIERRALLARRARTAAADRAAVVEELEVVRQELSSARARLTEERNRLIKDAVVVGGTLARFAISDLIWDWEPDIIIIDEASMASSPYVLAAAMRRPRTLALFGDFRQLPPVAKSRMQAAERWLVDDVFSLSGVAERVQLGRADDRLSILQTQFRMGSDIGAVVSQFAYFNMLRTHISADERAAAIAEHDPAPDSQLAIVDIATWRAPCLMDAEAGSFSRFNLPTALLSVSLATSLVNGGLSGVGVIAAYRAQARFAVDLVRGRAGVSAATTHRFQGAESDAIVLDLVDNDPQIGPSMLTGADPDLTRRLLNVAVSRARGKLVVLVDMEFVHRHHPPASPVAQLLHLMRERGAAVLGPSDLVSLLDDEPVVWLPSWREAFVSMADKTPRSIDIAVPDAVHAGDEIGSALERAIARGTHVTCRVPVSALGRLGDLDMDIKLKTLGAGPIALCKGHEGRGDAMVIGSTSSTAPAGIITGTHAIRTAWRLLTGEAID